MRQNKTPPSRDQQTEWGIQINTKDLQSPPVSRPVAEPTQIRAWLKVGNYFLNLARSLPETPRSLKPANMNVSDTAVTNEEQYYGIYTEALSAGLTTSSISHYCDDSLHQVKALDIPAEKTTIHEF